MTAGLRDWQDLLGCEACAMIRADEVHVAPATLAEQHGAGLFALGVHILTSAKPVEMARLGAWGEAGLAQHWARYYAPARLPDAVAREQAVETLSRNFDGLRLLEIYLGVRREAVTVEATAALAREGIAELARWRASREEPVKSQEELDGLKALAIASAETLPAEQRDAAVITAWHQLSDFERGRLESEATAHGLRLRNGWLLLPDVAAETARRWVELQAARPKRRGRRGAISELAAALAVSETEREIREVWGRAPVEAREGIEAEVPFRLVDWATGPLRPRGLVDAAKKLSGKKGRRALHLRAHCQATVRRHYLELTGRETPDWWKWGGPYFDFLTRIDEGYKTSLVQCLK